MLTDITHVTLPVDEKDEALSFYTETPGVVVRDVVEMEGNVVEVEGERRRGGRGTSWRWVGTARRAGG